MGFTETYKKREKENISKAVNKLKKDTVDKTDREILLEILYRVKLIGYSIGSSTAGVVIIIWLAYVFGWFN